MDFNDLTIDELREQASRLRLCLPYSDIEACRERAEELIEEGEALQNTIAFIVLIERRIKELEDEGTESSSCCYEQNDYQYQSPETSVTLCLYNNVLSNNTYLQEDFWHHLALQMLHKQDIYSLYLLHSINT